MSIDVVVSGASGRLGRSIAEAVEASDGLRLVAALVRQLPTDVSGPYTDDVATAICAGRVLVECAPHAAATAHVEEAARHGVPAVVATTGFTEAELATVRGASERIPILVAPNLSRGVSALLELVGRAAQALADFDIEVVEMHHRRKVDAPSGTAWALGDVAARARGQDVRSDAILARAGEIGPRGDNEIGMQSLRGGGVVGEHTVYLVGENERIELTHRASSRSVFADGAVHAVRFVQCQEAGLYSMSDALGAPV